MAVRIARTLRDTHGRASKSEIRIFLYPNYEATDYHFGGLRVLVIRSELLGPAHSPGQGITQDHR